MVGMVARVVERGASCGGRGQRRDLVVVRMGVMVVEVVAVEGRGVASKQKRLVVPPLLLVLITQVEGCRLDGEHKEQDVKTAVGRGGEGGGGYGEEFNRGWRRE